MKTASTQERLLIKPGEYRVTDRPLMISTLLGSCVSVCLYDPGRRVMGMNHFLLAEHRRADSLPLKAPDVGRYGIHAMEILVNELLKLGAKNTELRAKAFGGSSMLRDAYTGGNKLAGVGSVNVEFVREYLSSRRIPLISADFGGNHGRQIHFSGDDYSVYVRRISTQQSRSIIEQERMYRQAKASDKDSDNRVADSTGSKNDKP